jgi:hypothetical protein
LNSDLLDGARISRHDRIGWQKTHSVKDELEAVQERLGEIERAGKGLKLLRTIGNHDHRFDSRLASQAPEYEGVKGFALADPLIPNRHQRLYEGDPCCRQWDARGL